MNVLEVSESGQPKTFSFEEMLKYHGPEFPGGVAHSFKVMERAFAALEPEGLVERREINIHTAFRGLGARDGFELVTRSLTDGRYFVDPVLERTDRGQTLERYVFVMRYRDRVATLTIREGLVVDEFIQLARSQRRTSEQVERLTVLKQEMADRLMAARAVEVYDVELATARY